MAVSGQIEVIQPGSGKKTFFSESGDIGNDLVDAVENTAEPDSVVILNPGDYTGIGTVDIPSSVTVVLMPGATVSYVSDFRTNGDFSTTGTPTSNSSHPLRSSVDRYDAPDFSGAIENIIDLNLGSEWAFESDLEDLRATVNGEISGGEFFWNIESGDLSASTQTRFSSSISVKSGAPPTRTLRFEDTEGTAFNVTEGDIDGDGTDEITIRAENQGVLSLAAGRLLQLGNSGVGVDPDLASTRFVSKSNVGGDVNGSTIVTIDSADGGTQLYVLDDTGYITEFSLATPYDLSEGLVKEGEFDASGQDNLIEDFVITENGGKFFAVGGQNDSVFEYNLSTPYEIATAAFSGNNFDISSQTTNPVGLDLGDRDRVMIVSDSTTVYQYNLGTGAELSTASFDDSLDVSSNVDSGVSVDFNRLGNELLISDSDDNTIADYELEVSFDVTASVLFQGTLDVSGSDSDEFTTNSLVDSFVDVRAGRLFIADSSDNKVVEFAIADSGNLLIFHRDVTVDSAGFDELGQSVPNGVRMVSNLEINKSEPPTGGGGTLDGHVKRVGAIDLVGSDNIDITENVQADGPNEFIISTSGGGDDGGGGLTVEDPENGTSFGDVSTLIFGEGLDATSSGSGVNINHGDTGTNLGFGTENVVGTDDAGHVQEAVTVGGTFAKSLQVDSNTGVLKHDVSATLSDNTTTGTFLETISFDDNGHVTSASFSSAGSGSNLSALGLSFSDPTLTLENTDTSSTISSVDLDDLSVSAEPQSIYDTNGDPRATAKTDAGPRNRVGVRLDGDLVVDREITDPDDNFRLGSEGGTFSHFKILSRDASEGARIEFYDTDLDASQDIASIFYDRSADHLVLTSEQDMKLNTFGGTLSGDGTIDFSSKEVDMDTPDSESVKIVEGFEFKSGKILKMAPRDNDINPGSDIPAGTAAIYVKVGNRNGAGDITNLNLKWAAHLENGNTNINKFGST